MPINNPPLADGFFSQPWATWLTQVMSSIFGWKKTYTGTKVHDFGLIATLSQATTTVTILGVRTSDAVIVRPTTAVNGIIIDGTVTASDTVTIRAANYSAAGIDPASQTYRVIVFQQ